MPVERQKRLGNPGRRPLPTTVIATVADEIPDPPKHLLSAGKRVWIQVNTFASAWVQNLDLELLTLACEIADDRERLKRTLKQDGHFQKIPIMTSKGDVVGEEIKVHPARKELRAQDMAYMKALGLLGLTPGDRARLKLTEIQGANELDAWLQTHAT
jgi:P27 family predicted phage terminase small subunit